MKIPEKINDELMHKPNMRDYTDGHIEIKSGGLYTNTYYISPQALGHKRNTENDLSNLPHQIIQH